MGTPLFAAAVLFAPLQRLARWMVRPAAPAPVRCQAPAAHVVRTRPAVHRAAPGHAPRTARLRVVRVFEGPQAAAGAGRMVISGRMADVCAELERLAALETAAG
ncbi:hypothetical protein RAMLITH_02670 [Ramlibacter sp. RBP-2]|uniref:Uncharacterized protein n=1 Tax=Ramlibacter lithotrophicus TaxID=2606681 RepID=A0A7X6DCM1_9BURK|nr:hypothetical protein [Ramlibacter lithotrophicus]NKE64714.1 hypothetical protein [Ramlibacter lithotrophicus]